MLAPAARGQGHPDLLRAKNTHELDWLKGSLRDPALADVVERVREAGDIEEGVRFGLDHLVHYAPAGAWLSHVRDPKRVTDPCQACEPDGRKRNSVRRTLHRAISHVLRLELGSAERDRIVADVAFSGKDDIREVNCGPAEVPASPRPSCPAA